MARYVVLSFEDNDAAVRFADGVTANNVIIDERIYPDSTVFEVEATVIGVYGQPTLFCEGHPKEPHASSNRRTRAWVMGGKYGWLVCTTCHKPAGKNYVPDLLAKVTLKTAKNLLKQGEVQDGQ